MGPPFALTLILSSALLHALWNVLLGRTTRRGFDAAITGNALGWLAPARTPWPAGGRTTSPGAV